MALYTKPLPKIRRIDEPYWEGTRSNELRLQNCLDCGQWWFPPAEQCPNCLSQNYAWKPTSGLGTIWGRVFMHQLYYKEFADEIPYNIVWVALDEGPMMTANIVGSPNSEIEVDRRVEVCFDKVSDEITIPRFRLLDTTS
jgi:uncharacterized OB-fold protein